MTTTISFATADGWLDSGSTDYATAQAGGGFHQVVHTTEATAEYGQHLNAGVYYCKETFLSFPHTADPNDVVVGGYFQLYQNATTGTAVARQLGVREFDWSTTLTFADWRTPSQVNGLTRLAVVADVDDASGKFLLAAEEPLRDRLETSGPIRVVVYTDRFRAGDTPSGAEYSTVRMSEEAGTTYDPCLVYSSIPYHTLIRVSNAHVQLSDGQHVFLESDTGADPPTVTLKRHNGVSATTIASNVLSANGFGTATQTMQSVCLIRDDSDNIYLLAHTGGGANRLSCMAWKKTGTNTWAAQTRRAGDMPTVDGTINNVAACYQPWVGLGTIVAVVGHEAGSSGPTPTGQLSYALISCDHVLNGTGSFFRGSGDAFGTLVANVSDPNYFNGHYNETGTNLDIIRMKHPSGDRGVVVSSTRRNRFGDYGPVSVVRYQLNATGTGFLSLAGGSTFPISLWATKDAMSKVRVLPITDTVFAVITVDKDAGWGPHISVIQNPVGSNSFTELGFTRLSNESIGSLPSPAALAPTSLWDAVHHPDANKIWFYYFDQATPGRLMRTGFDLNSYQADRSEIQVSAALSGGAATPFNKLNGYFIDTDEWLQLTNGTVPANKYNYITVHWNIGASGVQQIRSIHTKAKILAYQCLGGMIAGPHSNGKPTTAITQEEASSHDAAFPADKWTLHQESNGAIVVFDDFTYLQALNVARVSAVTQAQNHIQGIADDGFDGIMWDDVNMRPGHGFDEGSPGDSMEFASNVDYRNAVTAAMAVLTPACRNKGLLSFINLGMDPWDSNEYPGFTAMLNGDDIDGNVREHFINWAGDSIFFDSAVWASIMGIITDTENAGKTFLGNSYPLVPTQVDNSITYGLASFYLHHWPNTSVPEPDSAFGYDDGRPLANYGTYRNLLGMPTETKQIFSGTATDGVATRKFNAGMVVVNYKSTTGVVNVPLGATYKNLAGADVTSVNLDRRQAAILLTPTSGGTNQAIRVQRQFLTKSEVLITVANRGSDGSQTNSYVVDLLNLPPNAPALTPRGNYDATQAATFAWTFSDPNSGDTQTAYQLQIDNATTLANVVDTGKVTSTTSSRNVTGGTLTNGVSYRWRVRTYDTSDAVGAWSGYGFFSTSATGTVNITQPATDNPAGVNLDSYTVQWSVSGMTQAAYKVRLIRTSNSTVHTDTGWVTSTATSRLLTGLLSGVEYRIEVTVRNSGAVESNTATRLITATFDAPETPIITVSDVPSGGYILIEINNPLPTGSRPEVTINQVQRRVKGTLAWTTIALVANDGSHKDYGVASDTVYEYQVVGIGGTGSSTSATVEESVRLLGVWMHLPDDPEGTIINLPFGQEERGASHNTFSALSRTAGREYPIADFATYHDDVYTVSVKVPFGSNWWANMEAVRNLEHAHSTVVYRDGRRRFAYGIISSDLAEADKNYGTDVSFSFTRVDYDESVV